MSCAHGYATGKGLGVVDNIEVDLEQWREQNFHY